MEEEELMEVPEIKANIRKIKDCLEEMKSKKMDMEILEIYLHHKSKVSMRQIQRILKLEEDFFEKLILHKV
jgi:hypothetical protein